MEQKEDGDLSNDRKFKTRRNSVVAGSVWETRMKMDQVKGGIKVFSVEDETQVDPSPPLLPTATTSSSGEGGVKVYTGRSSRYHSTEGEVASLEKRKRKNWQPLENGNDSIELRKSLLAFPAVFGEDDDETEVDVVKEVDLVKEKKVDILEEKEKELHQIKEVPIDLTRFGSEKVKEDGFVVSKVVDPPKKPLYVEEEEGNDGDFYENKTHTLNRLQSIVDLVMWKEISRTAFVFGFGTFLLLSYSYSKNLSFSLISAMSYLGLLYLALIFLYKSLCRGVEFDYNDPSLLIGEEEAIGIVKVLLPSINEVFIKIRALFSGDPAITMKLGVLLFVLAKCGGQITIWSLARIGFYGVFTVPKLYSLYSSQLSLYGLGHLSLFLNKKIPADSLGSTVDLRMGLLVLTFFLSTLGNLWVERCKDSWESCTHKKLVVGITFMLIYNILSTVARIWTLFMLLVTIRYYQQYMMVTMSDRNCCDEPEEHHHQQKQKQKQESEQQKLRLTKEELKRGKHVQVSSLKQRQRPLWNQMEKKNYQKLNVHG